MNDYEVLKACGHSAAMAATIVLDAERGDSYSIRWIKLARASLAMKPLPDTRARQMNAELPADQAEVLKLKGMI